MAEQRPAEPQVDGVLNQWDEGGWDALSDILNREENRTYTKSQKEERVEQAAAFTAVFRSAAGQIVLERLLDLTLRRASWLGRLSKDEALTYGLFREGQNSIVAIIMKELLIAETDGKILPLSRESQDGKKT